jgi:hypothetical protein
MPARRKEKAVSRLNATVLILTAVLMMVGCGQPVWQRPIGHPADPQAPAGQSPPITVFERYRGSAGPAGSSESEPSDPGQTSHGHQELPDGEVRP